MTSTAFCLDALVAANQAHVVPRLADGKPDLQGTWQVLNTAAWDIQEHGAAFGIPGGRGVVEGNEIPYRPEAEAQKYANFEKRGTEDPVKKCYLPGVPRITYMPFPFQIYQTPRYTVMAYEWGHVARTIFTDGSKHPDQIDFWMGDSRGHWDGDTFVVDVANFNDQTWFDAAGNFHSDALHVVERYTLTGPDHMNYEVTIEDAKVFARPWKMTMVLYRRKEPNPQLVEYACAADLVNETDAR
jgi:hypothetical protein